MSNLLDLSFWFDFIPLPFNRTAFYMVTGLFVLGILWGIISLIYKKKNKNNSLTQKIWIKLANFGFSFGIVGLILVFLKQQRTPYLGMRIWLAVWILVCLVWLAFILKYIFIEVPKIKQQQKEKAEFYKYI